MFLQLLLNVHEVILVTHTVDDTMVLIHVQYIIYPTHKMYSNYFLFAVYFRFTLFVWYCM